MKNISEFQCPGPVVSSAIIKDLASRAEDDYTLLYIRGGSVEFVHYALERMVQVMEYTGAVLVYSDHFRRKEGELLQYPVIDYQKGALRDDFDFGSVILVRTAAFRQAASTMGEWFYAGLYALRLALSRIGDFQRIPEFLYTDEEDDLRKSGEKQFDYVNPRNREVQIEMEAACTEHLKAIGAWLPPVFKSVELSEGMFPVEASVVIPCRNRALTIGDAIRSALSQETDFPYNVIVVDDNSTDGSVDIIRSFLDNPRFVYIAQDKGWHAIGGNWNAALAHPQCGRFAIQLDSDDVYSSPSTVQKFVDTFRAERCAMVIGTYQMTDFNMNPLPPGVIDHREWTPENGRNNALRINGLGAPRAFYVPLLRQILFPTVKYGEDYAVVLRICREYQIGRIYDVVYNCRRWDGNSDAALDIEKVNANNLYKDRLRTWEIEARITMLKTQKS